MDAQVIRHLGVVESTDGCTVRVRLTEATACGACRVRGHCQAADAREKRIDVAAAPADAYRPGDTVWVVAGASVARRAVGWAYVFPFLVLLLSLLLFACLGWGEALSACLSLALLGLYYAALWKCRRWLAGRLAFRLEAGPG